MSEDAFPSLNSVSLIGTVHEEPQIVVRGRGRSVTLAVRTRHDGEERAHRVVIQDEFLAKAVHPRLLAGAVIHVLGEIDYDDEGALVAVTNRRGSDVHVLNEPDAAAAGAPVRPSVPAARPGTREVAAAPVVGAGPEAGIESAPVAEGPMHDAAPPEDAPAEAESQPTQPSRPVTPAVPARPAVPVQPRPLGGGLRGGLSGLAATSAPAGEGPEDSGEPVAEEVAAPPAARAAVMVPRPAPMLAGRPVPPKSPTATPLPPRPAPPPGPRPPMPTGRPLSPAYPARKALGPAADDDDIPFAATMPPEFAAYDGQPITGCGIVPRGFPYE